MTDSVLTSESILDAAEEVFRKYGPTKTTVVDVARALEVSHGTIYRHFSSKLALRDAVTQRWLQRVSAPLAAIAAEKSPADERLRQWFEQLIMIKHQKVLGDPELFATYQAIAEQAREVVEAHVEELVSQIAQIIEDGVAQEIFCSTDSLTAAQAVFNATVRFHHPVHAAEWSAPNIQSDFDQVWRLIMSGLRMPCASSAT